MKGRVSYFGMSKRIYADRKAPDGRVSTGWRIVRKGGRVKIGGSWYYAPQLNEIAGQLVHVQMADYWMQDVEIFRGAFGCTGWFCSAHTLAHAEK